nr:thermonuclease family protein [Leucobacter manosquensis]
MAGGEARVRLIGLDTPEINRDGGQDDCYAQEARDELNTMVYGKAVELRADPTQDDTDRYGRLLRHVYIDGQSAAVVLLEAGAAHEYTYDAPYIGQTERRDAERAAQADELGMWGSCTG